MWNRNSITNRDVLQYSFRGHEYSATIPAPDRFGSIEYTAFGSFVLHNIETSTGGKLQNSEKGTDPYMETDTPCIGGENVRSRHDRTVFHLAGWCSTFEIVVSADSDSSKSLPRDSCQTADANLQ